MSSATDVVIVGAGIMGCASAWALSKRGISAVVLDKGAVGVEASGAAAGILGAQAESHEHGPLARLALASLSRYPAFAAELRELTAVDIGFRQCGVSVVGFTKAQLTKTSAAAERQKDAGLNVEWLSQAELSMLEPALAQTVAGAVRFPKDGRVDPPSLLMALRAAAEKGDARFRTEAEVDHVVVKAGRAQGVALADGTTLAAKAVVVTAGSWSSLIGETGLRKDSVIPARGQIVELKTQLPLVRGVIYGPDCYLSPRDDGRLLVGSTLEFVGFERGVTAEAVRDLLAAATRLVPNLSSATTTKTWSNFRPHTPDGLPLLGESSVQGLFIATGHFRNGILLAPITAEIVTALVTGTPLPAPLGPFAPGRFEPAETRSAQSE